MTDTTDMAKARARRLRTYFKGAGLTITHAQSLEAVANEEGFRDWNTYLARLRRSEGNNGPDCPYSVGGRVSGFFYGTAFTGHIHGLEMTAARDIWRITLQFDNPLDIRMGDQLSMQRRRVRITVDARGQSVTLAGKPDGRAQIAPD